MQNILIFGDSITWGAVDSKGGWAQRIKNETEENTVYILGISGDDSNGLLKRLEQEALIRLDEENQTALIIAIGINDSQIELQNNTNKIPVEDFRKNLNEIIQRGKKIANQIIVLGISPVNESKVKPMPWKITHGYTNEQIKKYNKIIYETAKENDVDFIDVCNKFLKEDYKTLLFDGLHPNDKGHELIYFLVKDNLRRKGVL